MVDENILKLEIKRVRDILNDHADSVFSLEKRKLQLETAMKERKHEVNILFKTKPCSTKIAIIHVYGHVVQCFKNGHDGEVLQIFKMPKSEVLLSANFQQRSRKKYLLILKLNRFNVILCQKNVRAIIKPCLPYSP